ncbi:MAG: hypothetical protein KUG69_01440 [Marinosulfonomonas sp.]|nr:hypothetical protein [Marinosulfonomonas sp.]
MDYITDTIATLIAGPYPLEVAKRSLFGSKTGNADGPEGVQAFLDRLD